MSSTNDEARCAGKVTCCIAKELQAQIEQLQADLRHANSRAQYFEEGFERRGDVLDKLQAWADAYPVSQFPEPDLARAQELLTAGGMTLGSISASNMRHAIGGVKKIVAEGLATQ